eukprot:NODE_1098_length_1015_cov_112.112613_g1053_i0.p1 GENE.NODE_1098_length_1015_cov_112.112613_g1053_i0~~NODE_1098_length_1015_cov_112.112613_g1053_i0.p1  ORF type:complete len:315 (+),score=17.04 NODE_1098_length_1015_cov_112.112613_g1053_i0:71-1015(+)
MLGRCCRCYPNLARGLRWSSVPTAEPEEWIYQPDFISEWDAQDIQRAVRKAEEIQVLQRVSCRRVLQDWIPFRFLQPTIRLLERHSAVPRHYFNFLSANVYGAGEGIYPHLDNIVFIHDIIAGLNVGCEAELVFVNMFTGEEVRKTIEHRSMYMFRGGLRYNWFHYMKPLTAAEASAHPFGCRINISIRRHLLPVSGSFGWGNTTSPSVLGWMPQAAPDRLCQMLEAGGIGQPTMAPNTMQPEELDQAITNFDIASVIRQNQPFRGRSFTARLEDAATRAGNSGIPAELGIIPHIIRLRDFSAGKSWLLAPPVE